MIDPAADPLPSPVPYGDGTVLRAVPYAVVPGFRTLLLDVYVPAGPEAAPLVVFVHGGGWRLGDRAVFAPLWKDWSPPAFARLTAAGFAVASVDYRLSGEATFPAPLDDVHAAVDWLGSRAPELGIDPARTVLWGESAGGHLVSLVGLRPDARERGVRGVVAWYGPADLLTCPGADADDSREALLLGGRPTAQPELARQASPTAQAAAATQAPPFHLAHGTADRLVPVRQSIDFAAALRAAGVEADLDLVTDADHLWMNAAEPERILERALEFASRVTD